MVAHPACSAIAQILSALWILDQSDKLLREVIRISRAEQFDCTRLLCDFPQRTHVGKNDSAPCRESLKRFQWRNQVGYGRRFAWNNEYINQAVVSQHTLVRDSACEVNVSNLALFNVLF